MKLKSLALAAVAALSLASTAHAAKPAKPAEPVRNVVLVHGGFVDGSGWKQVYDLLKKDGYNVSIVQNPTTTLADDVAFTKRADGRVLRLPSGNFFELKNGLITEIRCFFDTIDWVSQLTGRDMVGPLLREAGPELRPPNPAPAAAG